MRMPEYHQNYKDNGPRYPTVLTDVEWATIGPFLSACYPLRANRREMVNACLYLLRTGCGWHFLPTDFGPWETVRTSYDRLRAD